MSDYMLTHSKWSPSAHIWLREFALTRKGKPGICKSLEAAERAQRELGKRYPRWHDIRIVERREPT